MSPPTISHRDNLIAFLRRTEQATGLDDDVVPPIQIFLLGGNPLPIRVAAAALSPAVLILVATPQTQDLVHALGSQLKKVIPGLTLRTVQLPNHHDRGKLEEGLNRELADLKLQQQPIGLNYTGGTKTMAVNARLWWEARQAGNPVTLTVKHSFTAPTWMGSRTSCSSMAAPLRFPWATYKSHWTRSSNCIECASFKKTQHLCRKN